jgi:hypothetical protein
MDILIRQQQTKLAMHGCAILLLGLLCGIGFSYAATVGTTDSELYGTWKFAHLEGITNGLVVLAIAGVYPLLFAANKAHSIARFLLVLGCYCNIIGPILTALFIGHRVIVPNTAFEAFVVYAFYTPGTLPLISFFIFVYHGFKNSRA